MDIRQLIEQISSFLARLNPKQKTAVIGSLVIVIAFIAFLIVYSASAGKPQGDDGYRVLFDNLSSKDAALVVQELEKSKIEYKIPREGVIEVPKEIVEKERLAIAALGIPKDSKVGFELFDTQEFGATDFDKNIKYLRALEGELARTIGSLSIVEDAKVHIAIPKESVFTEKETPPTASIIVKVRPNMVLTKKQVIGIKNLVSAAVTKLTPENVKLVNENGDPLEEEDEDMRFSELAKQQLKYKKEYEKFYEEKITKVLAPILGGEDRVVARVTIEFDFSQKNSQSETYDPNSVVRSEQTSEEKREGTTPTQVGGVPGAVSNIGPVQGLEGGANGEKMSKSSATTNYEISKTTSQVRGEFAVIKHISAAVAVDGKYEPKKGEDGKPTEELEYMKLSQVELDNINNLVKQAVGFQGPRSDEVTVSNFQFRTLAPAQATGLAAVTGKFAPMIELSLPFMKYLLAIIVLFIFYKKVIEPLPAKILEELPSTDHTEGKHGMFELLTEDDIEDEATRMKEMKKKLQEELGISTETDELTLKQEVLLEKVRSELEERTDEIASLFMTLVNEEQGIPSNRKDRE